MPMFGSIKECLLVQKAMRDAKFRRLFPSTVASDSIPMAGDDTDDKFLN